MKLTSEEIATIVQGRVLPAANNNLVTGISTDSRTLQPDDLFVPLRGPNYDGQDYLRQAVEHGAAACLSEEVVGGLTVPVIQVDDALVGLGLLAAHIRATFRGPVFAITGTTGKTSTKEMLAAILQQQSAGLKTEGNFNNLIGLPLTLARLDPAHHWIVLELGMSHHGEIARLAAISRPDVAIITNVGAGHLAGVGDIVGVSQEKGELFTSLTPGGTAVVNGDDPLVEGLPFPAGVKRVTFAIERQADVMATSITSARTTHFNLTLGGSEHAVTLSLPGRHQIYNALSAAAAAYSAGIDVEDIVAGLTQVQMTAQRLEVRELPEGGTLLDDSYNANPQSMRAALTALSDWPCSGRRIAVLADMLELGDAAEECHREIGEFAAQKVDLLLSIGQWAETLLQAAKGHAVLPPCTSHEEIADWLREHMQPDDCLLVKGSRGMHMEKVVNTLLAGHLS